MMREYLDTDACRWRALGAYFGDTGRPPCGTCDNCRARPDATAAEAEQAEASAFAVGQRVRHPRFGEGVVEGVEGRRLTVLFDEAGYRTLAADVAEREGLLEPA
jgi:ATP-dependent DNA helicase RecQ